MTKKEDKKQNATKHGAYSRELMLPGEKFADYEELRRAHYDEWVPEGVTEQFLVDDLTALRWKKRRMAQYDQILLRQRNTQVRRDNKTNRDLGNLRNLGASFSEAANAEAAEEILARLSPYYVGTIEHWIPREKCQDPTQWYKEVGKYLSKLKSEEPVEGPDLFAAIVDPDLMENEISRSDRLDEAIDRKIKRLMQVKTAKQVFPSMRKNARPEPKLINAPARADGNAAGIGESRLMSVEAVTVNTNQEKAVLATQESAVFERTEVTRTDERGSAAASPEVFEIVHPDPVPAKVDFFAKPAPSSIEELNSFCSLCDSVMNSMNLSTSSNPASSPGPASN